MLEVRNHNNNNVTLFIAGTQLIHKSRPKRHNNITPDTIPERAACMNPTNDLNGENRRIDWNAFLMRSIEELKIPRNQEKSIEGNSIDYFDRRV